MDFIERNELRGFGQPVIVGSRLTVFSVLSYASDTSILIADFLKEFSLSVDELRAAVFYCKNRRCKVILKASDKYCEGCILRTISEGWKSIKNDFNEVDGISYAKDGGTIFFGSIQELEDAEFGEMGWLLAEKVEDRLDDLQKSKFVPMVRKYKTVD
jgi:uncharacterized protein (DUF433 family)